jgi:hypothetical protein
LYTFQKVNTKIQFFSAADCEPRAVAGDCDGARDFAQT